MALAYDTKGNQAGSGTININLTLDATVQVLVAGIAAAANDANRAGGAPTWNTTETLTQIGSTITGYKECQAEMWYRLAPTSGAHTLSVPNTGSDVLNVIASSYKGATTCVLDQSTSNNGGGAAAADPSCTLNNVPDGSAVVDCLADGYASVPTGNTGGTLLYGIDGTAWNDAGQYVIDGSSNGDIDNEDMADITDWIDEDGGAAASTQATFDSRSCMKLLNGASGANGAQRSQDIGSFGDRTVFSIILYHDVMPAAGTAYFYLQCFDGATVLNIKIDSGGLYVYDGAAFNEVGVNLAVADVWQEWTFDVDWVNKLVDVYLNTVLQQADVDCSAASAIAEGTVTIGQYTLAGSSELTYVDHFKAGSTMGAGTVIFSYTQSSDDVAMIMASFKENKTCALTGTVISAPPTEADIVTGGKTIILTLTGDTFVATLGQNNAITTAFIAGIDSAQLEGTGWDAVVKANMVYTDISRDSDTQVTVTLGAEATYDITANETITVTIPATSLTGAAQIVASPTFGVTYTSTTNIKTMDGLAKANVKTVGGLAITSVKTKDGLT